MTPRGAPCPRRLARAAVLGAAVLVTACPAAAHEYWLDPLDATLAPGQPIIVTVRNGEDFDGASYPFDPSRFTRIEMLGPRGRSSLQGRPGDEPALRVASQGTGLHMLLLEAGTRTVSYADMTPFEAFLDYHGLSDIARRHVERGLPSTDIRESYSRHAKTFVDVSTPRKERAAADETLAAQGMDYELIVDSDPYAGAVVTVQALFERQPLADVQIELFVRDAEGSVERRVTRSDEQGRASFDTGAIGDYLINSVHLVEPSSAGGAQPDPQGAAPDAAAARNRPHWRSYWSTLTFERDGPALSR